MPYFVRVLNSSTQDQRSHIRPYLVLRARLKLRKLIGVDLHGHRVQVRALLQKWVQSSHCWCSRTVKSQKRKTLQLWPYGSEIFEKLIVNCVENEWKSDFKPPNERKPAGEWIQNASRSMRFILTIRHIPLGVGFKALNAEFGQGVWVESLNYSLHHCRQFWDTKIWIYCIDPDVAEMLRGQASKEDLGAKSSFVRKNQIQSF